MIDRISDEETSPFYTELNQLFCLLNIQCYDIDTGLYDSSRIYTTDYGPSCSARGRDVKCDCGSYTLGDTWYMEYQDDDDIIYNNAQCLQCECKDDGYGGTYSDCDSSIANYRKGSQTCPLQSTTSLQCYKGEASTGSVTIADNNGGYYESIDESYYSSRLMDGYSSKEFCRMYTSDFGDFSTNLWDASNRYYWGSAGTEMSTSLLCEAFSNNKCTYTNITVEYTECDGTIDHETYWYTHQYQYCCTSDDCNYKDLTLSDCQRNTDWENWYKDYIDCIYDPNGPYWTITCDTSLTEITCSKVQELWTQQSSCICDRYKGIYGLVSTDTQSILQDIVNDIMTDFSEWEDVITNCDLQFTCNLSTN